MKMAEAATAKLAEEAVVGCVNQIKQQFRYLSGYHQNMTNLTRKVKNLEDRRNDVQSKISIASENDEIVKVSVAEWLENVEGIKVDAEAILKDQRSVGRRCWKGWFINVNLRYRLSKKAMKKVGQLDTFLEEGVFEMVAKPKRALAFVHDPTRTSDVNLDALEGSVTQQVLEEEKVSPANYVLGTDEHLESRLLMLYDVMAAVRDPDIRIVRICGMGGIGKTTIVNEVEKIARVERLFHEIAMVEVNQNPDLKILQLHIAEMFGLELKEDSVLARAKRLHERLYARGQRKGVEQKKILLILDNVWEKEDLIKAGVPLSDKESNCKILLTSRSSLVCKNIAPEQEFNLSVLPYPEDLILFRRSLGEIPLGHQKISEDLVKACGGLPLSLTTIAGAVKNKTKVEWNVALTRLHMSDLKGGYPSVFQCLKVSYDFLGNEKIQKFFRLCCLFPKGSNVSIENLVRYGIALRFFNDHEVLCEARDEAYSFVETLIHAKLLLSSDKAEHFKVHDIVFDFAVSSSSTDLFMVNHGHELSKWPRKDSYKNYIAISLQCGKTFQVSEELDCQDLKLLQLTESWNNTCSFTFPDSFFEGISELNVLDLKSVVIPFTVKSIQCLRNLRSFSLCQCSLGVDISMIGNLPNLEVLSFAHSMIKELPSEIGKLKKLRLLDLTGCSQLVEIAPRVLSQLSSLEELYMRGTHQLFINGSRTIYSEIKSLSTLSVMHIAMPTDVLPMDTLFKMLKKFKISIYKDERKEKGIFRSEGDHFRMEYDEGELENTLHLKCYSSTLWQSGITLLLMEAVRLNLTITGLKTLLPLNESKIVVFPNLIILNLQYCNELVHLANAVGNQDQYNVFPELVTLHLNTLPCLKDIIHVQIYNESIVCPFRNLKLLKVYNCQKLEHILTLSIARGLSKLEKIIVSDCENLNLIFAKEGGVGKVEFPNLKSLSFVNLPKLVGCHDALDRVEFPQLEDLELDNLPLITSLINNETRTSSAMDMDTPSSHPFFTHKGAGAVIPLQNLTSIDVRECSSLRYLSSLLMAISFEALETLTVRDCQLFEKVVAAEGKNKDDESGTEALLFPKLKALDLSDLPSLLTIFPEGCTLKWPSLENLDLQNCGTESIEFYSVKYDEQRVSTTVDKIVLSSLQSLTISKTNSLELWRKHDTSVSRSDEQFVLFSHNSTRQLKNLKSISLKDIESLEVVFDLEERIVECVPNVTILNKLEDVQIDSLPKMTLLWKNIPENIEIYWNLTSLSVSDCDSLRYLFSPSIAKILVKLKAVRTSDCKKIEEFVSDRDEEGQEKLLDILFFSQLERLSLKGLPCLRFLGPGVCDIDNLSFEAPNIIDNEKNPVTSTSVTLVRMFEAIGRSWSLHNLTDLSVYECGNMFSLFQPNLQVKLPVLKTLSIAKCGTLKYVFSSSTVKYLEQLQKLMITECKMMEEIVKVEDGEVGRSSKIVFPSLESVDLVRLYNLKGICLGTCVFDWPSLKSVEIHLCLKMGIFTFGYSDTPILDKILINSNLHSLAEGGSNINTAFTNAPEKTLDDCAFSEEGILTSSSFFLAAEHLIAHCPSWHWEFGYTTETMPFRHYFLIRRSVPCLERARTTNSARDVLSKDTTPRLIWAGESSIYKNDYEGKNETDRAGKINDDDDGKNIFCTPRMYTTCFTYDRDNKSPVLWLQGSDERDELLPLECMIEDIAEHYPLEFVSLKQHTYNAYATCVCLSLSPKPSRFIKQGIQLNLENYFEILLDSLIPTVQSCAP